MAEKKALWVDLEATLVPSRNELKEYLDFVRTYHPTTLDEKMPLEIASPAVIKTAKAVFIASSLLKALDKTEELDIAEIAQEDGMTRYEIIMYNNMDAQGEVSAATFESAFWESSFILSWAGGRPIEWRKYVDAANKKLIEEGAPYVIKINEPRTD